MGDSISPLIEADLWSIVSTRIGRHLCEDLMQVKR